MEIVENRKVIELDLEKSVEYPIYNFYQNDNNVIEFVLHKDRAYTNLNNITSVFLNFQRNDNVIISRKLQVKGNRAIYVMGKDEMSAVGQANVNLQLFEEEKRLTAILFKLNVVETFSVNNDTVPADDLVDNNDEGDAGQLDNTVLVQYLKITDAETTYRKKEEKITEADLDDEVIAKLGGGTVSVPAEPTETERALKQNEIAKTAKTTNNFTVDPATGTITSDTDFGFSADNVTAAVFPVGKNEMIFEAEKEQHWIVVGADDALNFLAFFGIGALQNLAAVNVNPYALAIKTGYAKLEHDSTHNYTKGTRYKVITNENEFAVQYESNGVFKPWYKVSKVGVKFDNNVAMNFQKPRLGAIAGISSTDKTNRTLLIDTKLIDRTTAGGTTTTVNLSSYATKSYVDQKVSEGGGNAEKKYAILVVAGQSNAVGFDESPVDPVFKYGKHERVKQLGRLGDHNMKIVPLGHCAENVQDMAKPEFTNEANPTLLGTKGIQLPLAKLLLDSVPSDYEIVVVPVAEGNTSFVGGKWGISSTNYSDMKTRVEHLLKLNEANYYIGTVWCQGEADAADPATHNTKFIEMTTDFFNYFNGKYPKRVKKGVWDNSQWFTYETTNYWFNTYANKEGIASIWRNYRTWSEATYVELSTEIKDKVNTTGKTAPTAPASHFGNDAYIDIASAVVAKMKTAGAI